MRQLDKFSRDKQTEFLTRTGWTFGWLTTVRRWSVEHHEVEIELDRDVVTDVKALVRRSRLDHFEAT